MKNSYGFGWLDYAIVIGASVWYGIIAGFLAIIAIALTKKQVRK